MTKVFAKETIEDKEYIVSEESDFSSIVVPSLELITTTGETIEAKRSFERKDGHILLKHTVPDFKHSVLTTQRPIEEFSQELVRCIKEEKLLIDMFYFKSMMDLGEESLKKELLKASIPVMDINITCEGYIYSLSDKLIFFDEVIISDLPTIAKALEDEGIRHSLYEEETPPSLVLLKNCVSVADIRTIKFPSINIQRENFTMQFKVDEIVDVYNKELDYIVVKVKDFNYIDINYNMKVLTKRKTDTKEDLEEYRAERMALLDRGDVDCPFELEDIFDKVF